MTPEDDDTLQQVREFLASPYSYANKHAISRLIAIIDDLRGELHGYKAAAEEEARAVDEQVATSDEHAQQEQAWERRARSLEIELSQIADWARQTIKLVPMRQAKRKVYRWCATCIDNAIANVNAKCPEPKERDQ